VLNLTLPGLELQERIARGQREMPIIFLANQCDVCTAVKAMKGGALEILTEPYDREALLNAIRYAIKRSEAALGRECELQALRSGYGSLTPREREVMTLVVSGLLNKQVGGELGISEITVKIHRGNVMRKMNAGSFAALVNMATRLHISQPMLAGAA
jgi:FixJ family two-component response regulator